MVSPIRYNLLIFLLFEQREAYEMEIALQWHLLNGFLLTKCVKYFINELINTNNIDETYLLFCLNANKFLTKMNNSTTKRTYVTLKWYLGYNNDEYTHEINHLCMHYFRCLTGQFWIFYLLQLIEVCDVKHLLPIPHDRGFWQICSCLYSYCWRIHNQYATAHL